MLVAFFRRFPGPKVSKKIQISSEHASYCKMRSTFLALAALATAVGGNTTATWEAKRNQLIGSVYGKVDLQPACHRNLNAARYLTGC